MSIKVYIVQWCPHCKLLINWLNSQKINYNLFDVDYDEKAWQQALKLTGGIDIVPVVEFENGKAVWGPFNASLTEEIIKNIKF